uniref:Uncharacterized protein n=1 Tax=Sipha flava TaxID=143950 RepID=A0A2S2PV39_9HEMI
MPNVSVANAAAITKNINTDTATNTVTAITTITDTDATTVNMSSPKETIIKTLTERNSAYDDFECDAQEQQQADLQKPSTSDELQLPILSVYTLSRICTIDLTDDDDNNTYNRQKSSITDEL